MRPTSQRGETKNLCSSISLLQATNRTVTRNSCPLFCADALFSPCHPLYWDTSGDIHSPFMFPWGTAWFTVFTARPFSFFWRGLYGVLKIFLQVKRVGQFRFKATALLWSAFEFFQSHSKWAFNYDAYFSQTLALLILKWTILSDWTNWWKGRTSYKHQTCQPWRRSGRTRCWQNW